MANPSQRCLERLGRLRSLQCWTGVLMLVGLGCAPRSPVPLGKPTLTAPTAATLLKQQRTAMGTQVGITLWAPATPATADAIDAAYAEMLRLEKLMTSWKHPGWPASDVMRIDAAAGNLQWICIAPETCASLALAQAMAQASDGAFDITYAPLRDVWRFDEDGDPTVPTPDAIAQQRAQIGFAGLELDTTGCRARLLRAGMRIDLGGIAKGSIVDASVRVLRAHGLRDFIVQAGGDMYVAGLRDGQPWRVAIQDPRRVGAHIATVALTDRAFSTAGDYERSFVQNGRRYHHILDPRTGYPATASHSVTIYAPDAQLADALDNAVFILGPAAGMALLERYPDCEAVVIDADDQVWVSRGLRSTLQLAPGIQAR